ncbi:putative late blight resistance protein homolog R1A-10 [Cynara cardunculus var. scolymus]|uniref:putative late blight resistance protein homolog R1A-10 n=1 Tax=Cynara cardunculus var. scolymus TaxID=59895 RepID=UPI000D623481|nr:putative late blight resistance protein homolog R1A-10 [Cynara cardunculus var. scolymus]
MDWEEMWIFAWLPNLEVLKLKFHACIGEKWDTGDATFQRLKILKLHGLDLRQWVCWRDNFPGLQHLVVRHCLKLEIIPSDIGKILTLDVIEVRGCSRVGENSTFAVNPVHYQGRTMDDALTLLLKQLFSDMNGAMMGNQLSLVGLQGIPVIERHLNGLINHVKKMMLGYENEEVQSLVKSLEEMARVQNLYGSQNSMINEIVEVIEELCNIRHGSHIGEEPVVGFDDEVETILDQLTGTSAKQLQVISITGMAGLGKTTLARKLYRDPLIEYVFDFRAWTCVSEVYLKRDLLVSILSSFISDLTDEINKMSDEQLGEKLHRLLKGHKYLVVLDDIWDDMAWTDLRFYFPDDKIGSRVLFTSRDIDVSLHVQAARPAHILRLRTADESWDIFQKKVFRMGICPPHLTRIGRMIAKRCKGLPLAIVIVAGLVKTQLSYRWWSEISGSLHSYMVRDPSQYMDTLALSYDHLPPHVRTCFLFLGVFPEDYDIPATKLIWLWVAQGFIHQTENRILEDVAKDFLMDLIKRSLLMIAKKSADGQIKACRIHDLLRDLCLRKAEEENFSPQIYRYVPVQASSSTVTNMLHGMSLNPRPALTNPYGLCYPFEMGKVLQKGGSVLSETYKSLKILDLESIPISLFPCDVIQLDNLRYLAIQAHDGSPRASISNLVNLQMLIILSRKNIVVPKTIWNMVNLRHLSIKSGENVMEEPCFVQNTENDGCPSGLASLLTLSQVSPQSCNNIFSRTPNLRKLGFCGPLMSKLGDLEFPNLRSLQHLQKLKLLNTNPYPEPTRSCNPIMFPENLKKLTLSNTCMDWEEMWTFSLLPNLEVLKLKFNAFVGEKWETSDAEFRPLKVLKLHDLDLRQWVCSRDNFPGLQRLVIYHCSKLNSIPSDVGNILTLDVIEVRGCSRSTWVSAQNIQKEQESQGNSFLKVQGTNNGSGVTFLAFPGSSHMGRFVGKKRSRIFRGRLPILTWEIRAEPLCIFYSSRPESSISNAIEKGLIDYLLSDGRRRQTGRKTAPARRQTLGTTSQGTQREGRQHR